MSKEEVISLNVRRQQRKAMLKHSTPVEASAHSKNRLTVESILNSSPIPKKSFHSKESFEDLPKVQSSQHLLQRTSSPVPCLSEEPSKSSQFTFPRRRLSTIPGSGESGEPLCQVAATSISSEKLSREPTELHNKSKEAASEQTSKWQDTTDVKEVTTKRKRKGNVAKTRVKMKIRNWELRQLQNIEEATTHELTIEEV